MGVLTDLISKVQDAELREKLLDEAKRLSKQKKFGLVFEDHIPECTPLWDIPVRRGSLVARKNGNIQETFVVQAIIEDQSKCYSEDTKTSTYFPLAELVTVAKFGQPIYPYLKMMDSVCNAPDSNLWHTLIEGDNYHALQLLEYLYAGKVDCIYIDPPYNTGAKDWKYNNNYVDAADSYRHSKWLSFMEKRLKLAKKLLNPQDSVLICTIDEKEYLHLGCLLEELFPEARIQMVSSVINNGGTVRSMEFSRTDEYIFFIKFGLSAPQPICLSNEWMGQISNTTRTKLRWRELIRHGANGTRQARPRLFFPILVSEDGKKFIGVGDALPIDMNRNAYTPPAGCRAIWPLHSDGSEGSWGYNPEGVLKLQKDGFVRLGNFTSNGMSISFLQPGQQKRIVEENLVVRGKREDGSIDIASESINAKFVPGTQWAIKSHNASANGSMLLQQIVGKRFSFPKSLYAVHDAIRFFVQNKPNALIIDFFAGSGTTLHAVNLLNVEDGGHRRCVMVTNNEVSAEEAEMLSGQGYHPGEPEWEKYGIARYVNWPRTVCSIEGHDINGNILTGEYLTTQKRTTEVSRKIIQIAVNGDTLSLDAKKSIVALLKEKIPLKSVSENSHYILSEDYSTTIIFDSSFVDEWLGKLPEYPHVEEIYIVTEIKRVFNHLKEEVLATMSPLTKEEPVPRPMADGFPANATFFKLGFLDKNAVALGRQFREMLPTLWMKAGAFGQCPSLPKNQDIPDLLALPENRFAVLTEETAFAELERVVVERPEIDTVFIITDHEAGFRMMAERLHVKNAYQLYRDYLDNFRINVVRS